MNTYWKNVITKLLLSLSPHILSAAQKGVDELAEMAEKTDNNIDDVFVGILQFIVGKTDDK